MCARREREPWLLAHAPELTLNARQIVSLYARRMQSELAFRDMKSHRLGQGFEYSLTRSSNRIEILLLHTLATFTAWLAGLVAHEHGHAARLNPVRSTRKLYSTVRLGWEALQRRCLDSTTHWFDLLRRPPDHVSRKCNRSRKRWGNLRSERLFSVAAGRLTLVARRPLNPCSRMTKRGGLRLW